jgi:hypothetical protein
MTAKVIDWQTFDIVQDLKADKPRYGMDVGESVLNNFENQFRNVVWFDGEFDYRRPEDLSYAAKNVDEMIRRWWVYNENA